MRALSYVLIKRVLFGILVLFGVITLVFWTMYIVPSDPAALLAGFGATKEQIEALREELGLNRPVYEQYFSYLIRLLHGDLGTSMHYRTPVASDLAKFFPASLELAIVSLVIALLVGIPLGIVSAIKRDSYLDHVTRVFSLFGASMPIFWLGLLAQIILYGSLGWFPPAGRIDPFLPAPNRVTGMFIIDSLLALDIHAFVSSLQHLVMPSVVLSAAVLPLITRITRASMLDVINQDYIKTAKAYGFPERIVIFRYALKNSIIPTITAAGLLFGNLIGGVILVETVFAFPGLGRYMYESIIAHDFASVIGVTLIVSVGYVIINLVVDMLSMTLDPRIRK